MTYVHVYQEWDILREQIKEPEQKTERILNMNSSRPSFGFLLQESRIRKRMTTIDVANAIGVNAKTVSMFENGSEIPTVSMTDTLKKILDI
jgi:DNA-binding XRE family transcriptional regulator